MQTFRHILPCGHFLYADVKGLDFFAAAKGCEIFVQTLTVQSGKGYLPQILQMRDRPFRRRIAKTVSGQKETIRCFIALSFAAWSFLMRI